MRLKIWEPLKCLFCINRRIGTFIIGYISSVLSTIGAVGLTILIFYVCSASRCQDKGALAGLCVGVILFIVHVILAVLLVVGTHKKNPRWMFPFLAFHAVVWVLNLLYMTASIIWMLVHPERNGVAVILITIVVAIVTVFLYFHFLCVIRAHYKELRDIPHERLEEEFHNTSSYSPESPEPVEFSVTT